MSKKKFKSNQKIELDPSVMAIVPVTYGSKLYSRVLKIGDEVISPSKPFEIVKTACDFNAANYATRKAKTKS